MTETAILKGNIMAKNSKSEKKAQPDRGLTLLGKGRSTVYPDSPEKAVIETFDNLYPERDYIITFDCPDFTSLCPVTGQPDFGHIIIKYIADKKCVESKALKLYLFSFRNHHTFHEEAVNRILSDLSAACNPRGMEVTGNFMPRGGISLSIVAETSGHKA